MFLARPEWCILVVVLQGARHRRKTAPHSGRIAHDIKAPFKLEGTDRIDDTPLHKALREALANALIHADYYDRRGLVIQKWPDKIRIANPGAFRINVQETLVGGVSDPRMSRSLRCST